MAGLKRDSRIRLGRCRHEGGPTPRRSHPILDQPHPPGRSRGYHTSIVTSFGIDFDAYESIVLPRLRGAGCHNNILMTDGRMLTQALGGALVLPRHAGRLYTVFGAHATGVFHPKLFLQLGRRGGRMIVSSANMTPSGLAGNLELAGEIICGDSDAAEQRLIASAWRYVRQHFDENQKALSAQIAWMLQRTPWLRRAEAATGTVSLADGTLAALLTTGGSSGIGEQFVSLAAGEQVTRLTVISPYWDTDLQALTFLSGRLLAKDIAVLIDPSACAFPAEALARLNGVKLYDRKDFREGRFLHAKVLIAQTQKADHVLFGSANCTIAALGGQGYVGSNEEVCLYRRFPPGSTLDALGLDGVFGKDREIDPGALNPVEFDNDLAFDALANRSPGRFEFQFDTLIWTPPVGIDVQAVTIELTDLDGNPLIYVLIPMRERSDQSLRYQLSGNPERPAFARLCHADGSRSSLAVVVLIDKIIDTAKEARSLRAEKAATQLADETEEGLWLLDILDKLEAAAQDEKDNNEPVSIPRKQTDKNTKSDPTEFQKLSYEAFIAGRQPRAPALGAPHNSLAGSDLSVARSFLNRLLGIGVNESDEEDDEEQSLKNAFNLGDDAENGGEAPEPEAPAGTTQKAKPTGDEEQRERERKAAERRATQEQIGRAVADFNARIVARKADEKLTTFEVLRLRALLMIVAAAGWAVRDTDAQANQPRTSLQVLSVEDGEHSWPRILGRVLFGFFGGNDPAVRHVKIDAIHDQVSDDILECWATCFWGIQACLSAPCSSTERLTIAKYIKPLAERAYVLTGLTQVELLASNISTVMDKLSDRFAARLGIDTAAVREAHISLTKAVSARAGGGAQRG
jgi:hypothetical protein